MKKYTAENYKNRISNIRYANDNVKSYLKKTHIHDYIPGQAIYNLGEYPNKMSIEPTEYDYNLIKSLSENGVGMIQIHEEWNDSLRCMGADKFSSHDKEGLKNFIKLCHNFNIKIIPYISSGFFDERDPDYSDKFIRSDAKLFMNYYRYRMCNAGSPEWNEYLMGGIERIFEEYEFDGLFNDMGYDCRDEQGNLYEINENKGAYDPFLEDILARIYNKVKKDYNGIVKIHQGGIMFPDMTEKVYDYIWVGESCETSEELMKTVSFKPFVIPCPDYKFSKEKNEDIYFSRALPFLQFPLRLDGRPITGERAYAEGIEYLEDSESLHFRKMRDYYLKHPDGPHVYSEWSDIPDSPEIREKWFEYLKLYKPMVTEDSICYTDIGENHILKNPLPKDVHMSLFLNEDLYLCVSNLSDKEQKLIFMEPWVDREKNEVLNETVIPAGKMVFLKNNLGGLTLC